MLRIHQMRPTAVTAWVLFGVLSVIAAVLASITAALSALLAGAAQLGDAACVHVRSTPRSAKPDLIPAGGRS